MVKKPLNLYLEESLIIKAKNNALNISKFLENQLIAYFNFLEGKHNNFNNINTQNDDDIDYRQGDAGGRIRTCVGHSPICSRGRRFSPLSHPSQKFNLSMFY